MFLNLKVAYSRVDNIIYCDDLPIIKLKQKFINIERLDENVIHYMNKYLEMWPNLFEQINMKNTESNIVKIFYDTETTGLDENKNGIHQLSGIIEVNDKVVETFDFRIKPRKECIIHTSALDVSGTTREALEGFPEAPIIYRAFLKMLGKYCDRFNRKDKMWLIGFNSRSFDDKFLRAFFEQNNDTYFGSWFWSDSIDVMMLASEYLINRRSNMSSFKLKRVAIELGLVVDETRLHDGVYDVELTREIYLIVTGREIEM